MKALLLTEKETLSLCELDPGPLAADEVLIDVAACGVCGTDLHLFHGEEGAGSSTLPLIMGHEFSGTVSAVGSTVRGFRPGDRVCVDPNLYCGECFQCRRGNVHYCEHAQAYGVSMYGGFAQQCRVREKVIYHIPDHLSLEHAALVEPVACCLHGIDRANIRPGGTVAVIGLGSIGQLILQLAKWSGAANLIAIEPQAQKREAALRLGATLAVDPLAGDVKAELSKAGIRSVDTVIECVGRGNTMELAVEIAGRGATVVLFGLTPPGTEIRVRPLEQVFRKELIITSSFVNPECSDRVIDLLSAGRLDLDAVITDRVPLDRAAEVFTDDSYRTHGKILILPQA